MRSRIPNRRPPRSPANGGMKFLPVNCQGWAGIFLFGNELTKGSTYNFSPSSSARPTNSIIRLLSSSNGNSDLTPAAPR